MQYSAEVTRSLALLVTLGACAKSDAPDPAVEAGKTYLASLRDTGAGPINGCRDRNLTRLRRVPRGPEVDKLPALGTLVCAPVGPFTFDDCARVSPKLDDACGHYTLDAVKLPANSADNKRFVTELAEARASYEAAVANARDATATGIYRESCAHLDGNGVAYADRDGITRDRIATLRCQADITVVDASGAPTASVVASATVEPEGNVKLEMSAAELESIYTKQKDTALAQVRAALLAKLP